VSDVARGPGWWLASDGRWYPPTEAPGVAAAAPVTVPVAAPAPQPQAPTTDAAGWALGVAPPPIVAPDGWRGTDPGVPDMGQSAVPSPTPLMTSPGPAPLPFDVDQIRDRALRQLRNEHRYLGAFIGVAALSWLIVIAEIVGTTNGTNKIAVVTVAAVIFVGAVVLLVKDTSSTGYFTRSHVRQILGAPPLSADIMGIYSEPRGRTTVNRAEFRVGNTNYMIPEALGHVRTFRSLAAGEPVALFGVDSPRAVLVDPTTGKSMWGRPDVAPVSAPAYAMSFAGGGAAVAPGFATEAGAPPWTGSDAGMVSEPGGLSFGSMWGGGFRYGNNRSATALLSGFAMIVTVVIRTYAFPAHPVSTVPLPLTTGVPSPALVTTPPPAPAAAASSTTPNLQGESAAQAAATLGAVGLGIAAVTVPGTPPGTAPVVRIQNPSPGTTVPTGGTVAVVLGPPA
jgi:hypothetical protein